MANITTTTVVYDNNRNVEIILEGTNDGSPNETLEKKVDLATLAFQPIFVSIRAMDWDVTGGVVKLYWDAPDPLQFATLSSIGNRDFTHVGGLQDGAIPDGNGNILLSTSGFDSGSSYSIRLQMKKKFPRRPPRVDNQVQHNAEWPNNPQSPVNA